MHPVLATRRGLVLYLLFWLELSIVPMMMLGPISVHTALLSFTSCVLFAFGTLPTWYLCRALPLKSGRLLRAFLVHSASTVLWASVWSLGFELGADALSEFSQLLGLSRPSSLSQIHLSLNFDAFPAIGALFYLLVVLLHYVLLDAEERRHAVEREASLALAAQQAELHALRAQVHPHFLFNSLNTVSALIGYDPGRARQACILLGEYLRATLGAQERALVTLADEWALSEKYLEVESLRLGERLRIEKDMNADTLDCLVPSLLLQPLVENAVTHGVALVEDPSPLVIKANRRDARLVITLENTMESPRRKRVRGLGIENVRARLFAHYAKDASLRIEQEGGRFRLILDLPASGASDPVEFGTVAASALVATLSSLA